MSGILDYLKKNHLSINETLLKLTKAESPSHKKALVDICGEVLRDEFETLVGGSSVMIEKTKVGNQYKFTYGAGEDNEQALVIGHMDTVWDKGALPIRQDGNILYRSQESLI